MADIIIAGKDVYVTIGADGQSQRVIFCQVSATRNYSMNVIDSSSKCNPASKTPGIKDYTLDVSLQRTWDPALDHYSEKFLHDAFEDDTLVDYTVGKAAPTTGDLVETGKGYITSMTKTDDKDNPATMDITITATEAPVLTLE